MTHPLARCVARLVAIVALLGAHAASASSAPLDTIVFGSADSERAHALSAAGSDTITGGLGEPARRLLPPEPAGWEGGRVAFRMKVDPEGPNYATVRFWGDDVTPNRLFLHAEGKQIGYRHLGDIDLLDSGSHEPAYHGRFFYTTTPLPLEMTRGKTEVNLEIRSTGRIWGYGRTFEQYQRAMTEPTRGIYRLYIHTDGHFVPPADERQGDPPASPAVRAAPGPEVIEQIKQRVGREIDARLAQQDKPLTQMQMQLLAKGYHVTWTSAYRNPKTVEQLVASLDAIYRAYRQNPKLAQEEPSTWNPDWFGLGPSGQVIALLASEIGPRLDESIDDGAGATIARRAAYADMLLATREHHRRTRRLYTNQSMIKDLYGIYFANRGLAVVAPDKAMPEPEARRYLYESVGLQPWLGSDTDAGPSRSAGENYMQLTAKGLTKELGYVGSYGEVLDWVNDIYEATRPAPGQPGDERIKGQLVKIAAARAAFRHPSLDADGYRTMRLEQVVGWRDAHYPGDVVYGQRPSRDASALQTAANTLDPVAVGAAQQMLADNQFFASELHVLRENNLRTTIGRLHTPDQYERVMAQPPSPHRLPMSAGQGDYVFTDEENGVLAVKRDDEILYVSLYWRARHAINNLARVHYLTPRFDRIAVVRQDTQFDPSGHTYNRPNWTNFGFANGGLKYPGDPPSAHAGEQLPIAKVPAGVKYKVGDENIHAGKGTFYQLRYGPYLIGMNMTTDRTFELARPDGVGEADELVSKKRISLAEPLKVGPRSTVVLWLGNDHHQQPTAARGE